MESMQMYLLLVPTCAAERKISNPKHKATIWHKV